MESSRNMGVHETVIVDINYCSKPELNDESIRISCSGTVLDENEGLILTTGLLFGPIFQMKAEQHDEVCLQKLTEFFSSTGPPIIQREKRLKNDTRLLDYIEGLCTINVFVESKVVLNNCKRQDKATNSDSGANIVKSLFSVSKVMLGSGRRRDKTADTLNGNSNNNSNNKDKVWLRTSASIATIWKCSALDKVLQGILNQNTGWTMTDSSCRKSIRDEEHTRTLLPFLTILKLNCFHDLQSEPVLMVNRPWKLFHHFGKSLEPYLMDMGIKRPAIGYGLDYVAKVLSNFSIKFAKDRSGEKRSNALAHSLASKSADVSNVSDTRQEVSLSAYLPRLRWLRNRLRSEPCIGSPVQIMATPFGSLSPSVFLNSVSKGVIANLAGEDGILLMTDARCVPGCEGGAIYLDAEQNIGNTRQYEQLVGIVIAPFCWRMNEWVGLTFGCTLRPLLTSLLEETSKGLHSSDCDRDGEGGVNSLIPLDNSISMVVECVSLIKVGSRWGSAVLVHLDSSDKVFLLTCRHVVQQEVGSMVRARFSCRNRETSPFYVEAKVIYVTPNGQVYDIAVLEVDTRYHHLMPKGIRCSTTSLAEGDGVFAVGHGLFDEHIRLPATVTSGNVSKILHRNGKHILVQTTCAVHPGMSGGALVSAKTMQLIGIIVCNAKDASCGASYPHINLSIPTNIFGPVLNNYAINQDSSVFNCLCDPDPVVNRYWQLDDDEVGQLHSKL